MYSAASLDLLWRRLKDEKTSGGQVVGLREVKFSIPLEEFSDSHKEQLGDQTETRVTKTRSVVVNSPSRLVTLLNGAHIIRHHLTCAAKKDDGDDTAICVHYKTQAGYFAAALPGINYVRK